MKIVSEKYFDALAAAEKLLSSGYSLGEMDIEDVADLIYKINEEREEKIKISDSLIDYNDEITSIEDVGIKETIDISVTGDNLFYCNGLLTKNSWGLPQTADLFMLLIINEQLDSLGQVMVKQLKNRYNDLNLHRRFVIGMDKPKMRLYDIEEGGQSDIMPEVSTYSIGGASDAIDMSDFKV
jgi:hypothetical protein